MNNSRYNSSLDQPLNLPRSLSTERNDESRPSNSLPVPPHLAPQTCHSPRQLIKNSDQAVNNSDAELYRMWCDLHRQYFPQREDLAHYQVTWATNKRKRTLASCNLRLLKVTLASELRHEKHYQWLSPLLYHEMCHAVLHFEVGRNGRGMRWHGPEFRELEMRHPQIEALNQWAKNGGWLGAIRSNRARRSHQKRSLRQQSSPKEAIKTTKVIRGIRVSVKSSSASGKIAQIISRGTSNSRIPPQTTSGQFLLFLRDIKRKLIGR